MVDRSAGTAALSGAEIAASLQPGFADPAQQRPSTQIGQLIDDGEAAVGAGRARRRPRSSGSSRSASCCSRSLPPAPDGEFEDAGETALLLTDDPERGLPGGRRTPSAAHRRARPRRASATGSARRSTAPRTSLRVLSYNIMKARAGTSAGAGSGPLLADAAPRVAGRPGAPDRAQLRRPAGVLRARRRRQPGRQPGRLAGAGAGRVLALVVRARAGQPVRQPGRPERATPTGSTGPWWPPTAVYDWAVGVWYPKASFLAQQDAAGRGRGPVGRHGRRRLPGRRAGRRPGHARRQGGTGYDFAPGTFYRVDAASVINDIKNEPFSGAHSDIKKLPWRS